MRRSALGALALAALPLMGWAQTPAGPARDALIARLAREAGLDAGKEGDPAVRAQLDAELRMRELLEGKAERAGLERDPEVAASLRLARQSALAQAYLDRVEAKLAPTAKELRADYESGYPEKRMARVKFAIFASESKAAEALAAVAAGKESIEAAAARGDDQLVANRGGDFGLVALDALPEEVAARLVGQPAAKWPDAPVRTAYGHVVYELLGMERGRELSFEQARPQLEKTRRQMLMRAELSKIKLEARGPAR